MPLDAEYTAKELPACVLARELRDEELGIIGAVGDVFVASVQLARLTTAPGLWWLTGPGGPINAWPDTLVSPTSYAALTGHEAQLDLDEMIDYIDWRPHRFDYAFLSGMQVDRFGNLNTVKVRRPDGSWLWGPGAIGAPALSGLARRFYIVMNQHTPRHFVAEVDVVSALGHSRRGKSRADLHVAEGGPALAVSPLGVFDFGGPDHAMRLVSRHPGVTVDEIGAATGFPLETLETTPATVPPTPEELDLLRTRIDPTGVLR